MTKDEIKAKYHSLAAQAGDLYFRVENAREALRAMEAQLTECRKQKNELEAKYKEVQNESAADAPVETV